MFDLHAVPMSRLGRVLAASFDRRLLSAASDGRRRFWREQDVVVVARMFLYINAALNE